MLQTDQYIYYTKVITKSLSNLPQSLVHRDSTLCIKKLATTTCHNIVNILCAINLLF
jgi:hypothetical protein